MVLRKFNGFRFEFTWLLIFSIMFGFLIILERMLWLVMLPCLKLIMIGVIF